MSTFQLFLLYLLSISNKHYKMLMCTSSKLKTYTKYSTLDKFLTIVISRFSSQIIQKILQLLLKTLLQWQQFFPWDSNDHLHLKQLTTMGTPAKNTMIQHSRGGSLLHHFLSVVTPTTTLLTSLPLSSTVMGFSTTTVWPWDWGAEVEGRCVVGVAPFCLCTGIGTLMLLIPTLVTYWHNAHLTDGAPYGYMRVVWHWPQFTWAGLAKLIVWQQEHLTLAAPRVYISTVWQPLHTSWAISTAGGTEVIARQIAQQTFAAPLG